MKLADLDPRWLSDNVFIFKCPHCVIAGKPVPRWLSCKNVPMKISEQFDLFNSCGMPRGHIMVPMNEAHAWNISGKDFATMTVTPSIDASPSGDWHGFITNGNIA